MNKTLLCSIGVFYTCAASAIAPWRNGERQAIWPEGKMPFPRDHQIGAMTDEVKDPGFVPAEHRMPYLEWFEPPASDVKNGACMILVSGGSYQNCCDVGLIKLWRDRFTALGYQCVNFVYRTPRPRDLAFYATAWADGQRAIRVVRSQAAKRGFAPDRVGLIGMSAGGHLTVLLATSSQTPAYEPVDELDKLPCHLDIAVANAPAYTSSGGERGTDAQLDGRLVEMPKVASCMKFDSKTCPISFHHGGTDTYSPNGSTLCYREVRKIKVPAELHIYADYAHGAFGLDRAIEFLRQMNFDGRLGKETERRIFTGAYTAERIRQDLWPEGKVPGRQSVQTNLPFMTWYIPKTLKTKAVQVIFPGGGYNYCNAKGEGLPVAEYFNSKGMTAVVVEYRCPRPKNLPKYWTAWQDAQRAIRLVRHGAAGRGLDPERIGSMGFSAGGHLTLMTALSSTHRSYRAIDDIDRKVSCKVQWSCPIYPAYALTDGADRPNVNGGNNPEDEPVEEFLFDVDTPPMCFIHGDKDGWAAMNSVRIWEKLRRIGAQSDLHTLATRGHCFQFKAADGTGSATWLDQIWDFLKRKKFVR